jgi:hypothetical protein
MIGLCLVKAVSALPTWTETVALVQKHWKLQRILGCEGNPPSKWAAYRFVRKLCDNRDSVQRCIESLAGGLKSRLSTYGTDLHADLTVLTKLAWVLSRVRAANGAAPREGGNALNHRADPESIRSLAQALRDRRRALPRA